MVIGPVQKAFRAARSAAPLHGLLVHVDRIMALDHDDESEPEQPGLDKVTLPVMLVLREEAEPPKGVLQVPDPALTPDWNPAPQEMQPNMVPVDVWRTNT